MLLIISLTLTITAIILLYLHLTRNFNYWKNRNIPYIKPVIFVGNIFKVILFKKSIGQFLQDVYNTSKFPYVGFYVFDKPFLMMRNPEYIKLILIKDFDYFDDRSITENRRTDELGADILFIIKNPTWKTLRTKLTPVYTSGKIKNLLPLMIEATEDLKTYINDVALKEDSSDSREMCMKYATDVIASCAFGINAHSFKYKDAEFRMISRRIFCFEISRSLQMASYFFAPILVELFGMRFIDPLGAKFMKDVFWKSMIEREKSQVTRGDLVDTLLEIKKKYSDLDGGKLVAQAVQFFIAGFETSGSTISFTLYEISLNPSIQDRLRKEIRSVLDKHGGVSYEAIQEMKYLDRAVCETLRKYPTLPFLDRRCKRSYTIPGTDFTIEKGIPIYFSLLGLHNDPEFYPDPDRYDPDRFTEENKSTRPSCVYMPFGEGPHNCIGARFGSLTTKVALVQILADFEVELSKDTPVPMKLVTKGVLLGPEKDLKLRFKRHIPQE